MIRLLFILLLCSIYDKAGAQLPACSNNAARSWWDVQHYDLRLQIDTGSGHIQGTVVLTALVVGEIGDSLQVDLDQGLSILDLTTKSREGERLRCSKERLPDCYVIKGDFKKLVNERGVFQLIISYEGTPVLAHNAPWDGGRVMSRDATGNPWLGMACQGKGASVWFPCKNYQGDEPDKGMRLTMVVPAHLKMISNGRCVEAGIPVGQQQSRWSWEVASPINNYDLTFYIGDYIHLKDSLQGIQGALQLDYFVLRGHEVKARQQFAAVRPMLQCFEHKLGPYPFYKDGYKLVEAPYLGMEHQSAIAYGNGYQMGYKGTDRSGSGVGLLFDFILIHESAHEWFGNSITAADKADTWVHEGFTSYAETIFVGCLLGEEQAFAYQRGKRQLIRNDRPVQGLRDVCDEGSGDHYDKAAYLLHMIRCLIADDDRFFTMLRALNATFYHRLVSGAAVEQLMSSFLEQDLSKIFDQYLRQVEWPELLFREVKGKQEYKWQRCVPGFDMPVIVILEDGRKVRLAPRQVSWTEVPDTVTIRGRVTAPDFLVELLPIP